MTISSAGSYDVTLEMRDTTGTVISSASQCDDYADPSLVGAPAGARVTSEVLGSQDDPEGLGCLVTITGVAIPDAGATNADQTAATDATAATDGAGAGDGTDATASSTGSLVVRDGDLYVVTLPSLASSILGSDSAGSDASALGTPTPDTGGAAAGSDAAASAQPSDGSVLGLVTSRVSITFPGAVADSGGGSVNGRTVTWDDTDVIVQGVSASGYAAADQGVSLWDRFGGWIIAAVVAAGAVVGVVALRRRR